MKAWISAASVLVMLASPGCANDKSEATAQAAECERLRDGKDYSAAVPACRAAVEKGCAAFGATDTFCGTAHMRLGMALGGTGDQQSIDASGPEFQAAERILCADAKRASGECVMAQALTQRFGIKTGRSS